jgi:hypothetical protein
MMAWFTNLGTKWKTALLIPILNDEITENNSIPTKN